MEGQAEGLRCSVLLFESRWHPCRARRGAESSGSLRKRGRRRSIGPRGFVRHGDVRAAGRRDRRADRSTLGGLPRPREISGLRACWSTPILIKGRGARLLRHVSSGAARPACRETRLTEVATHLPESQSAATRAGRVARAQCATGEAVEGGRASCRKTSKWRKSCRWRELQVALLPRQFPTIPAARRRSMRAL